MYRYTKLSIRSKDRKNTERQREREGNVKWQRRREATDEEKRNQLNYLNIEA